MIRFISSFLFKDCGDFSSPSVRKGYGLICSCLGIALNFLMFFVKLIAGRISGSIAVRVDAFHNLTDMGSSAVTLISFLLPEKNKAVKEKLAELVIGVVLIFAGLELADTSAEKMLSPASVEFSSLSVFLLVVSVAVKFYMSYFNRKYGRLIDSPALKATSVDCLCDSIATAVAAVSVVLSGFTDLNIDAYGGFTVSLFILFAGCKTVVDSVRGLICAVNNK